MRVTNVAVGSPSTFSENNLSLSAGVISHGSSYVLSANGISFGTKPAQTPFLYDDCGGSDITTLWDWAYGDVTPSYKTTTFRGVDPPNTRMAGMIAGARSSLDSKLTVQVAKTIPVSSFPHDIFATWYISCDPLWADAGGTWAPANDKQFKPLWLDALNGSQTTPEDAFFNAPYSYQYVGCGNASPGGIVSSNPTNPDFVDDFSWRGPQDGGWDYALSSGPNDAVNLIGRWVRYDLEWRISNTVGYFNMHETHPLHSGRVLMIETDQNGDTVWNASAPIDVVIGTNAYIRNEGDNNYMYYADLFIDHGMNRVMLGNANTLAACTVLEPQPYTAWSTTSITLTANLGGLSTGTVYMYFVDDTGVVGGPLTLTAS